MLKLSSRLQIVFDHLLPGKPVWDLCCDHGHLGIAAYKSHQFSEVHFVDPVASIIQRLEVLFTKYSLPDSKTKVSFHSVAGENLQLPVGGTLCATGVGAHTIIAILRGLTERDLLAADRLILGPHKDEELVTEFFLSETLLAPYSCKKEVIVEERGRERKLLIFSKNNFPAA